MCFCLEERRPDGRGVARRGRRRRGRVGLSVAGRQVGVLGQHGRSGPKRRQLNGTGPGAACTVIIALNNRELLDVFHFSYVKVIAGPGSLLGLPEPFTEHLKMKACVH